MKVLAFGTFDVFHPGHEFYLKSAAKHGTLHVVVARDLTVERVKGRKPKNNEDSRLAMIRGLPYVDMAILGSAVDRYAVVESINPDVIVMGYDQSPTTEELAAELQIRGINPKIYRVEAFMPDRYKSSLLRESQNERKKRTS